jgi:hypothetical protein
VDFWVENVRLLDAAADEESEDVTVGMNACVAVGVPMTQATEFLIFNADDDSVIDGIPVAFRYLQVMQQGPVYISRIRSNP